MPRRTIDEVYDEENDNDEVERKNNDSEDGNVGLAPSRRRQRRERGRRSRLTWSTPSPPLAIGQLLPILAVTDLPLSEEGRPSLDKQLDYALTAPGLCDNAKKIVVQYIQGEATNEHPPDEVARILDVASRLVIRSSPADVRSFALGVYRAWATAHAKVMAHYLLDNKCQLIDSWMEEELSCSNGSDRGEAAAASADTSAVMQSPEELRLQQASKGQMERLLVASAMALSRSPRLQDRFLHAVCTLLPKYIGKHSGDIRVLSWVAAFFDRWAIATVVVAVYEDYHLLWRLCRSAILSMACADEQGSTLATNVLVIPDVAKMFRGFWKLEISGEYPKFKLINLAVSTIFSLGSHDYPQNQPHLLLASVLQTIPVDEEMVSQHCYDLLISNETDKSKSNLLLRLIAWMKWPGQSTVSLWATTMWDIASSLKLYNVMELAVPAIEKLVSYLQLPYVRMSSARLLEKMFVTRKGPDAFHKALPKLLLVLHKLLACAARTSARDDKAAATIRDESALLAKGIAIFIFKEMKKYPGYHDVYKDATALISNLPLPDEEGDQEPMQLSADDKALDTVAKPYGKTGLVNHDSLACYSNAILQMLYALTRFRNTVLHATGVIPDSPRKEDQPVLGQLQRVFAFLAFSEAASYDARDFRATSMPPDFIASTEQQDASELLTYLLDQLDEQELASSRHPLSAPTGFLPSNLASSPPGTDGYSSSDAAVEQPKATDPLITATEVVAEAVCMPAAEAVCTPANASRHRKQQPTLGSRYFRGCLTRQYKCLECGFVSQMPEQFYQLAVHLTRADEKDDGDMETEKRPITVAALVQRELRDERLVEAEQRYCDHCQCNRDAMRSSYVSTAPDSLIVWVSPFSYDRTSHTFHKICARVCCDYHLLLPTAPSGPVVATDMLVESSTSITGPSSVEYKLRAAVIHRGRFIGGGHYFCIARHDSTGAGCSDKLSAAAEDEWFKFDDDDVRPIDFNSTAGDGSMWCRTGTPYLLLYERAVATEDRLITDDTQAASTIDIGAGGAKPAEACAGATDTTVSMLMNLVKSTDARNARVALRASNAKFSRRHLAASVKTSSCRPQSPKGSRWDNDDDDDDGSRKYSETDRAQNDITGSRYVY